MALANLRRTKEKEQELIGDRNIMDERKSTNAARDGQGVKAAATLLKGAIDPVYEGKAQTLNNAIQAIGMGRYQWQLFLVVGGFGWASDNLWPIVTSLILPVITNEFSPSKPPMLLLAQNIGLLVGAIFWGFGCTRVVLGLERYANSVKVTYSVDDGHSILQSVSPQYSDSWQRDPPIFQSFACSVPFGVLESEVISLLTVPSFSSSSLLPINTFLRFYPSSGPSHNYSQPLLHGPYWVTILAKQQPLLSAQEPKTLAGDTS